MKNLKDKQTKLPAELPSLTDYYWQKRKDAQEEVEQMSKHPLSLAQVKKQIEQHKKVISGRK